jgi:hypothetical protein
MVSHLVREQTVAFRMALDGHMQQVLEVALGISPLLHR